MIILIVVLITMVTYDFSLYETCSELLPPSRYFTFRIHLGVTHQIKDSEEKKAFIEVNQFLTDVYTCKVWGQLG